MIIKSANLMALQYLLAEPEDTMEKAAKPLVKRLVQAPQKARGAARNARKKVMRNPQVEAHNNAQRPATQQAPAPQAPAPQAPAAPQRPAGSTHNFDSPATSFSGGGTGGSVDLNMPQYGPAAGGMTSTTPSFRRGMSQVGQGFGEMGSAIAQGGRNAINRGLQAGANAAKAVKSGLQTTGNAIAGGARAVKNGLQATGNAIAGGVRATGNAVMNGGRNALEWAQKNPGLALGGGYVLYDQLTDN